MTKRITLEDMVDVSTMKEKLNYETEDLTIRELLFRLNTDSDNEKYIERAPSFQRGYCWKEDRKVGFWNRILKGDAPPPLVVVKYPEFDALGSPYLSNALADGVQRASTIKEGIEGDLVFNFNGEPVNFKSLPKEYQQRILNRKVPVIFHTFDSCDEVCVYTRDLNTAGLKMKRAAVRGARFAKLPIFHRIVLSSRFESIRKIFFSTDKEISARVPTRETEIPLSLIFTASLWTPGQPYERNKYTDFVFENIVRERNENYEKRDEIDKKYNDIFERVLRQIKLFRDIKGEKSSWFIRKYSSIAHRQELWSLVGVVIGTLSDDQLKNRRLAVVKCIEDTMEEYINNSGKGKNGGKDHGGVTAQTRTLRRLHDRLLEVKDTNPCYLTAKQKALLFKKQGGMCSKCLTPAASYRDLEADHIEALMNGGSSELDNFTLICNSCHRQKTREDFKKRANTCLQDNILV